MTDSSKRSALPRWFPFVLVAVAAVIALTVIALSGGDRDPSTPEGAAQGYVRAVIEGDDAEALASLSPDLGCTATDLRHAWVPPSITVRLGKVEAIGTRTVVELIVEENVGPFGSPYEYREYLTMERSGESWVIVETPWPIHFCEAEVDA